MKEIINNLKLIQPPKMIREALALYGTLETPGPKSNPTILAWAEETKTKYDNWYTNDSIPWCGLAMAVVAQRAGKDVPDECLKAASWVNFGKPQTEAMLGDIMVFSRKGGHHVCLNVGESVDSYFGLGGNQSDKFCITRLLKSRCIAIRRPHYDIQPESVKKYYYTNAGELSNNEE